MYFTFFTQYSYLYNLHVFVVFGSFSAARTEVVSTFPSEGRRSPHTTRSWEFLGFEEGLDSSEWLPSGANAGENVIVGMLDSGEIAYRSSH